MTNLILRRDFLNRTALGGIGLAAATSSLGFAADDKPSERVVVGVMGLSRGRSLATQFAKQPNVEVKYLCDVDSTRAESCVAEVEKIGGSKPQAVGDFRQILDDKDVDALICAAPNHWHAPATILACKAGKHVYVEKPCCHSPREGELMIEAARKYQRAVQVGTQRRSSEGITLAVNLLREGKIGRVYAAKATYASARGSIGTGKPADVPADLDYELWQGPSPRTPYVDNRVHYNWHWFWQWGNGELGNNGVHTLDLCRWGLGVDYPIRVTSSGGRYCFDDDQQTPDTHMATFEFEGGGLITWHGFSCNRKDQDEFITYYGDKGALRLDDSGSFIIFDEANKEVQRDTRGTRGDNEHIVNFLAAVRNEKPLDLNAEIEEGHKSTLLCHLGNIAQRTGRTLNCNPQSGQIIGDEKAMKLWSQDYESGWEPTV
ncbi:MAG: Gfo/Idh/MocA family oxidoreductase [Planctomycetaceae bacterium]